MISSKKILEGCLLVLSRETTDKWNLYLDGVEFADEEDPQLSKMYYSKQEYNQHLIPLYKLSGFLCLNVRSGLSSSSILSKRKEISTIMNDFPGFPKNVALFSSKLPCETEDWWLNIQEKVVHKSLTIRNKAYVRIPTSELVIGDIVFATAGDILGADIRIVVCSPGSVIDISPIVNTPHAFKELHEKPTSLDPLKSSNVAPAHCALLDGMFFGIVIRTGTSTLYSKYQQRMIDQGLESTNNVIKYPFVLKRGDQLVKMTCKLDCYPVDIDRLLTLRKLDFIVISLAYEHGEVTEEVIHRLSHFVNCVVVCRDMDVCYDKGLWIPDTQYVNLSYKGTEEVENLFKQYLMIHTKVIGVTVHPSQYYSICKTLQGNHDKRILFVGGNSYEHFTAMNLANVNLVYATAKDICKIRSHGILCRNTLSTIIELLELFSSSCSVKCNIF